MSANWSWVACGCLVVAMRDGLYWAVDGQHRLFAAKRRSDIKELPCLVFATSSIEEDARGFLSVNCERKPISVMQRHKAMVVSGNEAAKAVQAKLLDLGLSSTTDSQAPGHFKCFAWAMKTARDDYDTFSSVIEVAAEISIKESEPIKQTIVQGFTWIHRNHEGGITEARILERIKSKGCFALDLAARKAAALQGFGGQAVWGKAMLDELNKGLTKKFIIKGAS
jgi:hypothetical protein